MALTVDKIKADLAEQERQRAADQELLITESRKADLDRLAKAEVEKRSRRISDLERAKTGLKKQIFELTAGGKILDEKKLREAVEGYNASDNLQSKLGKESSDIISGKYRVSNGKIVFPDATKEALTVKEDQAAPKGNLTLGPDGKPIAQPRTKLEKVADPDVIDEPILKTEEEAATVADEDVVDKSLAKSGKDKNDKKTKETTDDELEKPRLTKEEIFNKYPIIDALFDQDEELQSLLNKYLNPKKKMTADQFEKELGQASYTFKYKESIRNRLAQKAIYDRLGASATGQSQYEMDVATIASTLEATAINIGAAVTKEDINRIATNLYLAGTEENPLVIERALTPFIKLGVSPTTGRPTVGGAAGLNYQALLTTAKANGIKEEQIPGALGFDTADQILVRLAEGEPINTFQQRLRDIAAYGRSDYVKNLLAQGTNFDLIVSPYRNLMANVLEIANTEQISLDDPTLSMALGKEEMTLSDFNKVLRKDDRWQYTDKAKKEVSDIGLRVLRDFGFQG